MDRPRMRNLLRELRSAAWREGYINGEHPLGGAYLHSRPAVDAIAERAGLTCHRFAVAISAKTISSPC